jgi:hypothetical protein
MSCIYFHTEDSEARVSGCERASMGLTLADIAWSFLASHAQEYGDRESILRAVLNDSYVSRGSGPRFKEMLATAFRISMGSDGPRFLIEGVTTDPFIVHLNTGFRIGADPLRLFARLHGQCEIHTWVDGPNRNWLAGIIEEGRKSGLYRKDMGWESVIELLRSSDAGPVVTSYSVCEQFPNSGIADWEDDCDGDAWYDLPDAERWERAFSKLRERESLELRPDEWADYYFGNGLDVFKVIEAAQSHAVGGESQ